MKFQILNSLIISSKHVEKPILLNVFTFHLRIIFDERQNTNKFLIQ